MNNFFLALCLLVLSFLSACTEGEALPAECYTPAGCSPEQSDTGDSADSGTPPDDTGNGADTGGDTGDSADSGDSGDSGDIEDSGYTFEENQLCWDSVPFEIQFLHVDRDVATTVETNWDDGLNWLDYDPVYILDGSSGNLTKVYWLGGCGNESEVEGEFYLPSGFEMRDESDELYNNGIVVAFQPDGTVVEVSYLTSCGDGTYEGYILPDGDAQQACDVGYSNSVWLGAHGGSHTTATQAILPGELTSSDPIGRALPIEVDHTHLKCPTDATSGYDCHVGPLAASGDYSALTDYTGSIDGLSMGGILILPATYDCTQMATTPAERLCEVLRDQFMFVVDDSYGQDEVAFPMEDSVPGEVLAEWGIELHNATGQFAMDLDVLMASVQVVTNPDDTGVLVVIE